MFAYKVQSWYNIWCMNSHCSLSQCPVDFLSLQEKMNNLNYSFYSFQWNLNFTLSDIVDVDK